MNNQTTVIALPGAKEILERLKKVWDDGYMVEVFYPLFEAYCGANVSAKELAFMFDTTINSFVIDSVMDATDMLHSYTPTFIRELVENKDFANKAISIFESEVNPKYLQDFL